jgi:hypothetical protein
VLDHTSTLRFLETRFGVEVPNLSAWRRSVTGDLTSAFNFLAPPDRTVPALPAVGPADSRVTGGNCAIQPATLGGVPLPPYPVPPNAMPRQEPGRPRRPSGCGASDGAAPGAACIRLSVSPSRVKPGRRTRFSFHATVRSRGRTQPVARALIRFRGGHARTNRRGRAAIVRRLRRSGNYLARATKRGLRAGNAIVRVRRRSLRRR